MIIKNRFDIIHLKGKLGKVRDWMIMHHIPPRLLFFLLGIISTIWFLVRVLPKPGRASYPCMKVAAPFMSGMIIYLLSVGGITVVSRKLNRKNFSVRYASTALLIFGVIVTMAITPSNNTNKVYQNNTTTTGPDDGPNQPVGTGIGINPGRVIWAWDPKATNGDITDYYFNPEYTNQKVVSKMFIESLKKLSGKNSPSESWDAIFRYFNNKKHLVNKGYTKGEKVFIKINQTSGRGRLKTASRRDGNYNYPSPSSEKKEKHIELGTCETGPYLVLEILRQLVNECGINQSDIAVGDPQNPTFAHNYDAWVAEFPNVVYTDKLFGTHGRTLIHPTVNTLIFYSDKHQTDKLHDIIENADYMINVANLKPHIRNGITLTAKNHFGSQSRDGAYHLHYSLVSPIVEGKATNSGYNKYRVLVDLMGSKYLGQNTLLFVIDGLHAGGSNEGGPPVKYFMSPFNNDWSNSIFISEDQVALESVCYDFLRTEWNGTYTHDPSNSDFETMPNVNGVDDYLHQAADSANWPVGITYDPDNSGNPIPSLGTHEHWNNSENKQYSRNLGKAYGIELISIPAKLVGSSASKFSAKSSDRKNSEAILNSSSIIIPVSAPEKVADTDNKMSKFASVVKYSFNNGFKGKKFYAAVADDNNRLWFLTDVGIVNERFSVIPNSSNVPTENVKNFVYELSNEGPLLWLVTTSGAVKCSLPEISGYNASLYSTGNSKILSDSVFSLAIGKNNLRWFGTDKGISALYDKKWLTPSYEVEYPEMLFKYFPITALATTNNGDSLYAATKGAGVARVFRNEVDGISGASSYAQWGSIKIPSDNVYSICITSEGVQWFGTDMGVARHTGYNTLDNWTVYNTDNGLIDNFVSSIAVDSKGMLWFGTKGGVSVFNGSEWTSYTMKDGLISNNILSIISDKDGRVYIGTDNGIMVYFEGELACYQ